MAHKLFFTAKGTKNAKKFYCAFKNPSRSLYLCGEENFLTDPLVLTTPKMKSRLHFIFKLFILGLFLSGCSFYSGGNWVDDPGNWERAFQLSQPDEVTILHSEYWQSSHWSLEYAYYFEIESNDALLEQLFSKNEMIQLQGQQARLAKNDCFEDCPTWFAPKSGDAYEIWVYKNHDESHFRILIDKETGKIFIMDYLI